MAKKSPSRPSEPPQRPMLTAPREVAREKLQTQIDKGVELRDRQINSASDLEAAKKEFYRWEEYNYTLLRTLFTTDEFAIQTRIGILGGAVVHQPLFKQLEEFHEDLDYHIDKLVSYKDQLGLIQEDPAITRSVTMSERHNMQTSNLVFIGHGRAGDWRDLKDFLRDRLDLPVDEFNAIAAAGMTTKERLEEMLKSASFAFLVMTAEDERADGTKHARENVIHEVGLFQGRLGFRRAIILLEEGCGEFSNIAGLVQIRYPKGHICARYEEIRGVLEREGII